MQGEIGEIMTEATNAADESSRAKSQDDPGATGRREPLSAVLTRVCERFVADAFHYDSSLSDGQLSGQTRRG